MYTYLKKYCRSPTQSFASKSELMYEGLTTSDVRWNFEKFLIDRSGRPVARYSEKFAAESIAADIELLLTTPDEFH